MKCPFCLVSVGSVSPYDWDNKVVEACRKCAIKKGMKRHRVWTFDYYEDGRVPIWWASVEAIIEGPHTIPLRRQKDWF